MNDLQCAWILLLFCASSRADYALRNVPPADISEFAEQHDHHIWQCFNRLMGHHVAEPLAQEIAQLPFREGGLGLRCAQRNSTGAYWASWVDSLSQIAARHPDVANWLVDELEYGEESSSPSIQAARDAATSLQDKGMLSIPSWTEAKYGISPPDPVDAEPGEFRHGWQFHAVDTLNTHYVSTTLITNLSPTRAAARLSSSGPCAGRHFTALPLSDTTTFSSEQFRGLLSFRLGLDLPLMSFRCRCGQKLDRKGYHRAACSIADILSKRTIFLEVVMT